MQERERMLTEKVADLQSQLAALKDALNKKTQECNILAEKNKSLQDELMRARQKISDLENVIRQLTEERNRLAEELAALNR